MIAIVLLLLSSLELFKGFLSHTSRCRKTAFRDIREKSFAQLTLRVGRAIFFRPAFFSGASLLSFLPFSPLLFNGAFCTSACAPARIVGDYYELPLIVVRVEKCELWCTYFIAKDRNSEVKVIFTLKLFSQKIKNTRVVGLTSLY